MIERQVGRSLSSTPAPRPRVELAGRRAFLWPTALFGLTALLVLSPPAAWASESSGAVAPTELAFAKHGGAVTTRTLDDLRGAVPKERVRVYEPYESGEAEFVALPFAMVLDLVYGEEWRSEEELLFTCSDGYQPTLPVARVLAHRAWLAFDRVDADGFVIRKRESGEEKTIALGPFYLIWDNLGDDRIRQEADYGWPYQLVGVDLIRTRDRFPRMMPPDDATPEIRAGFAAFRVHCSKCHKLNGEGGSIGPELNAAVSPVQYRDRAWLHRWIDDPSQVNPATRMPPLNSMLPERDRVIDEILAYLGSMVAQRLDAETESSGAD
jgi:mono/diheme cytochrome c family protein